MIELEDPGSRGLREDISSIITEMRMNKQKTGHDSEHSEVVVSNLEADQMYRLESLILIDLEECIKIEEKHVLIR